MLTFENCPIITHAAPNWYFWCSFRFHRIIIVLVAIPFLVVNLGELMDLIYGDYTSNLDRVLKGYLLVQISCGVVSLL